MAFLKPLLVPLAIFFRILLLKADTNVSINQSPAFKDLRDCAGLCLQNPATYVDVRSAIGCPANPLGQNECYCRADLQPSASAYLTACVNGACGPGATADVIGVISVYNLYCATAEGVVHVAVTTESGGVVQTVSSQAAATVPVAKNTASADGATGLSVSDKIALGVGIGFGVPAVIAAIATVVMCMRLHLGTVEQSSG